MKLTRKSLAILLAISCILSVVSLTAFAADEAIESPIIPIGPVQSPWFEYEYTETPEKTAVLTKFNWKEGRQTVTVRGTVEKDGEAYAVVGIAADAFKGNANIKSVTIQDGVKFIGKGAFENCTALANVEIAATVNDIDPTAFDGTAWLAAQPDGLVYAGKVAYKMKGAAPAEITLAADTVAIAAEAFKGQTSLKKIIVPENTTVGADAFSGCTDLVIYCYENSSAHQYAVANEIDFVLIPSLVLKSAPTKVEYYQNDALVLNGIEVIYISAEGENAVEVLPEMISGYNAETLGAQTVTVTYEGKTVQFQVTVIERPAFIPGDVNGSGVVDMDDAIHLLFNYSFPAGYPVNQPVDFDGSGAFDMDDAIYLLFHYNFPDGYPLH